MIFITSGAGHSGLRPGGGLGFMESLRSIYHRFAFLAISTISLTAARYS